MSGSDQDVRERPPAMGLHAAARRCALRLPRTAHQDRAAGVTARDRVRFREGPRDVFLEPNEIDPEPRGGSGQHLFQLVLSLGEKLRGSGDIARLVFVERGGDENDDLEGLLGAADLAPPRMLPDLVRLERLIVVVERETSIDELIQIELVVAHGAARC